MFEHQCFIRKTDKEIIEKLKRIGHKRFSEPYIRCDAIAVIDASYSDKERRELDKPFLQVRLDVTEEYLLKNAVDCGTNEELFLAIAALRDDTDKDQVFMHQDGNFYKCECDSKIDMWGDFEEPESYPRKATVSELIELFKR